MSPVTPTPRSLLRPRDADALRATLRAVATEGDVPVLFGGEVHGDTLLLSEFVGTRTQNLRGLAVRSRSGLGGASMVAARPNPDQKKMNQCHRLFAWPCEGELKRQQSPFESNRPPDS